MLKFEKMEHGKKFKNTDETMFHLYRSKIPGGWLVLMRKHDFGSDLVDYGEGDAVYGYGWGYGGVAFVPDPNHIWDGSSIH